MRKHLLQRLEVLERQHRDRKEEVLRPYQLVARVIEDVVLAYYVGRMKPK